MSEKEIPTLKAGNTIKTLGWFGSKTTTPDYEEVVSNSTTVAEPPLAEPLTDTKYFLERILGLEERLDRLEDRVALYNVRSQHRI